ncbi:MAG TPA: UvrD-helicase domain-containing protein [Bdellovibrionales bacterium]|nr:UvrD-helicase domain-containing protein [Bdellovibrionales bacterium]
MSESTPLEKQLASLNPPQKDAAETLEGPLLILAGAGSGKTRVLTFRTANLIAQGLASPEEILAVTFTNKAAKEMESRILSLLKQVGVPVFGRMWISTFHSICARILREHIHLLDYKPFFGIYDSADQLSMVKKVVISLGIDEKTHPAKSFAARINAAKTDALTPDDVRRKKHFMDERSIQVYAKYEEEMRRANSLDFGDLLMKTYQLFTDYPAILESYQRKFRYIMVDEYQDTNRIQYLLVQKLASAHRNICVVGDEDQSIYSWRGADINNILDFEKDFGTAKVVKLEQNYRSTKTIIGAATHVIKNNSQRKDKTLFTENMDGEPIIIREETNEYDEARFVVGEIQKFLNSGDYTETEIAVFYRTNAQSRVLEEQFRTRNIQYKIVGGMKFYERMEIKDVLAYMKLILNPTDDIALKRIINVPARGIGKTTVDRLEEFAAEKGVSMIEATALAVDHREFNAGATSKLRGFLNILSTLRDKAPNIPLPELYHAILDETQYVIRLKEEDTPEAESRIENLEELDNAISKFAQERGDEGTLQHFLEEMALVSDQDQLDEAGVELKTVTMMTLHISKGLEYPVVFIVGMEENLFPSSRADETDDPTAIEEERRLCYVGMTRAEKRLFLTYARTRKVWGTDQHNAPSRFLKELPKEGVIQQTSVQRPKFMDRMRSASSDFDSGSFDSGWSRGKSKQHPLMTSAGDAMPNYEDFGDESFDEGGGDEFKKGMRVRHPSYGVGSILQVEGKGVDTKVSVVFGDNTVKKFVAKYARLERV